jgi:hypothetical protein
MCVLLSALAPRLTLCHLSSRLVNVSDACALALLHGISATAASPTVPTTSANAAWPAEEEHLGEGVDMIEGVGTTGEVVVEVEESLEARQASAAVAAAWEEHLWQQRGYGGDNIGCASSKSCGAPWLRSLKLGGKLTDLALRMMMGAAIGAEGGCGGHSSLARASGLAVCPRLQELKLHACERVSAAGVIGLLASGALPELRLLSLPAAVAAALPRHVTAHHGGCNERVLLDVKPLHATGSGCALTTRREVHLHRCAMGAPHNNLYKQQQQ